MQVATQPSPIKAVFNREDIESATLAVIQHLIAQSAICEVPANNTSQHSFETVNDYASKPSFSPLQSLPVAVHHHHKLVTSRSRINRTPLPIVVTLVEMGFTRKKVESAIRNLGMCFLNVVARTVQILY
jgi:E3 ubiquitin-protein ligase HERC2